MIHAIYKNGQIQPVDEIPEDWEDGKELVVDSSLPSDDPEEIKRWSADMRALGALISDEDHATMMAAIEEQRRVGKEQMRREMGL